MNGLSWLHVNRHIFIVYNYLIIFQYFQDYLNQKKKKCDSVESPGWLYPSQSFFIIRVNFESQVFQPWLQPDFRCGDLYPNSRSLRNLLTWLDRIKHQLDQCPLRDWWLSLKYKVRFSTIFFNKKIDTWNICGDEFAPQSPKNLWILISSPTSSS